MITIDELIKIIVGALVVVVVLLGLGFYLKDTFIQFFKNVPTGKIILNLI